MQTVKMSKPLIAAVTSLASAFTFAAPVTPSFDGAPAGWTVDRYAPAGFEDIGSFEGRNDVLRISINESGNAVNRPAGQQTGFYNTQGRAHAVSGGAGSVLAADLYIDSAWADAANGSVRTDMWGVVANSANATPDYGIIGFTNYGGDARLRVFDANAGGDGWVNLATAIAFDNWNAFAIEFTGTSLVYSIGGSVVYTDSTLNPGATGFSSVIMQAYNFADPAITGATVRPYDVNWSNAQAADVPEPGTLALFSLGLAGAAALRRRNKRSI